MMQSFGFVRAAAARIFPISSAFGAAIVCALLLAAPAGATTPAHEISSIDGVWSRVGLLPIRLEECAAYDPVNDQMIIFGGRRDGYPLTNETTVWSRATRPQVSRLDAVNPTDPIPALSRASAIYDPIRRQVIVFGGNDGVDHNDVWTLSLSPGSVWTRNAPLGTPPTARSGHSAIYDPVRDRMIVLGGVGAEVWALSLSGAPAWTQLTPTNTPAGGWHSAFYDPVDDRIIAFVAPWFTSVWQLELSSSPTAPPWSQLAPTGTPPASDYEGVSQACALDPIERKIIVLTGDWTQGFTDILPATDVLSLGAQPAWSRLGPFGTQPLWRYRLAATFDPVRHELLINGGLGYADVLGGLWGLTLAGTPAWHQYGSDFVAARAEVMDLAVYDSARDRLIVAGVNSSGSPVYQSWYSGALPLSTLSGWQPLNYVLAPDNCTGIYDPRHDQIATYGGSDEHSGTPFGDAGATPLSGQPGWSADPGPSPPPGTGMRAILDSRRDRMVVYGGGYYTPGNDVWALPLSSPHTWTQLAPSGSLPPARYAHVAIYDPLRDRMIVFGGATGGSVLNDTWALDFTATPTWTQLLPAGSPPPAGTPYFGIYDPIRDRMVIYGAAGVWGLSLSGTPQWSTLGPSGIPPHPVLALVAYDSIRDRLLVHAKPADEDPFSTYTWALTWGQPARPLAISAGNALWTPGQPVNVEYTVSNVLGGPRAIGWRLESARNWPGLPIYGTSVVDGNASSTIPVAVPVPDTVAAGTNALEFTAWYEGAPGLEASCGNVIGDAALVGIPDPAPAARLALAIEGPRPNPARELRVAFVLPIARAAELDVFDVSGRRVAHQALAGLTPGRHEYVVHGAKLGPGVYMIRLRQDARDVTTRAIIIQ